MHTYEPTEPIAVDLVFTGQHGKDESRALDDLLHALQHDLNVMTRRRLAKRAKKAEHIDDEDWKGSFGPTCLETYGGSKGDIADKGDPAPGDGSKAVAGWKDYMPDVLRQYVSKGEAKVDEKESPDLLV